MYIQPMSEDGVPAVQLPRDYAGTAFSPQVQPDPVPEENEKQEEAPAASEAKKEATPTLATQQEPRSETRGKGSLFSFLSGSPLLSSFLPPPRKGHEGEGDVMQWILVGLIVLLLLSDSDDDILPLLLLLLLWK